MDPASALRFSSQATAAASLILVLIWIYAFDDLGNGLGWRGKKLFNWHPLFMILAYAVFLSEGIMAYRAFSYLRHSTAKVIHGFLQAAMLLCSILGFVAVAIFHNEINAPHFYSVHSWVGAAVLSLCWLQFGFSALVFGVPQWANPKLRRRLIAYHRGGGRFLFAGGVAAMVTGLMQKQSFIRGTVADKYASVLLFANGIAVTLLVHSAFIFLQFDISGGAPSHPSPLTTRHDSDALEHDVKKPLHDGSTADGGSTSCGNRIGVALYDKDQSPRRSAVARKDLG